MAVTPEALADPGADEPVEGDADARTTEPPRERWFSGWHVAALVVAVAFLVGAIAFVVGQRDGDADPLNAVDVGFMQDMGYHHEQAVQMSLLLLAKEGLDPNLTSYAQEIIIGQRYEQGVFSATLDRFHHDSEPGDTVMGWMGEPLPIDKMTGLATDAQMEQLRNATGKDAEALWIALMSEHHLAGLHMADYAARHGKDETTRNLALSMVKNQRSEVLDLARYRTSHDLPIPKGFSDPTQDQRLNPLSFRDSTD
ncbi:DUF305 domain-containing protein [Aquihabitans sp. McL0605]|uniref:DUF305 domain-containing protein n=1 Tax=Aquihabitans sp. McL0605 TaxID=3415671 RepID=UPI003CF103FE